MGLFSHFMQALVELPCPFCGHFGEISVKEGGGEHQKYTEDCPNCAHPRLIHLDMTIDAGGGVRVWLERADES